MDILKLAQQIIDGKRLGRKDDSSVFLECGFKDLCEGADRTVSYTHLTLPTILLV